MITEEKENYLIRIHKPEYVEPGSLKQTTGETQFS
jgi:hypothetical protein